MSRSYDIFLSHSGAQKDFVEQLNDELVRVCGHYSVFFDRNAIKYGEQISTSILEYARTCKLAVAVVSEEYFTRSRPPMMELAASYTAAKAGNGFPSLPCLLPVFLALRPEDAKDSSTQSKWRKTWRKWELNETMSERRKSEPSRVQLKVWREAVDRLLDTLGPIYIPQEYGYDPEVFMKKVAQDIARKLDDLNQDILPIPPVVDPPVPSPKEVDHSADTGVKLDSSESSSASGRVAEKVTNEKNTLSELHRSGQLALVVDPPMPSPKEAGHTGEEEDSSESSSASGRVAEKVSNWKSTLSQLQRSGQLTRLGVLILRGLFRRL